MQITFVRNWMSSRLAVIVLTVFSLSTTSCRNMFTELADQETDAAFLYDAQRLIDDRNYSEAINKISEMSSAGQAKRETKVMLASAYVGRCGLDYILLADKLINDLTGATVMEMVLEHMAPATSYADCLQAETILRTISPSGSGIISDDANDAFLMAFVSLAKLGALLAIDADTDNNSTVDGTFNPCDESVSTGTLDPTEIREVATALTLMYNNLQSSGSDIAAEIAAFSSICGGAVAAPTCAKTTTAAFNSAELMQIQGVINYASFGLGNDGAFTACPFPGP